MDEPLNQSLVCNPTAANRRRQPPLSFASLCPSPALFRHLLGRGSGARGGRAAGGWVGMPAAAHRGALLAPQDEGSTPAYTSVAGNQFDGEYDS